MNADQTRMWFKKKKTNSSWFAKDFPFSFGVFREKDVAFVHLLGWGAQQQKQQTLVGCNSLSLEVLVACWEQ